MKKTIEEKATETILQKPAMIKIGQETYEAQPIRTATLIEASAIISKLPAAKLNINNLVYETLSIAKNCRLLGDLAALLVLGAQQPATSNTWPQIALFKAKDRYKETLKELSDKILYELSPKELNNLITGQLMTMEISDFFGLTTSLLEINLLKETREVGNV